MKLDVIKLDGKAAGSIDLGDDIFGLEPRVDILHASSGGSATMRRPAPIR